ncbi:MAG: protease modulator HflC, partial [Sphingomonas sp.]
MNAVSFRNPIVAGIIALLLVILAASTFAIVPETKQAVILRFGQPIRTVNA